MNTTNPTATPPCRTSRHARRAQVRAAPVLSAALALAGLAGLGGCGGAGVDDGSEAYGLKTTSITTRAVATDEAAPARSVRLEGCVVDAQWLAARDTAVHVRAADGRALGTAFTDARGVFVVEVPARSAIVVATDWAGPGALALHTGSMALSLAACLPSNL